MTKYEPFKDVQFAQSISGTHVFITQSHFNERLSVAGSSHQTLLIAFRRKNLRIQVSANILWTFFFAYDETVTIPSRLIFAFAIFALHISNMLMVQKEELSIKSPKLRKKPCS